MFDGVQNKSLILAETKIIDQKIMGNLVIFWHDSSSVFSSSQQANMLLSKLFPMIYVKPTLPFNIFVIGLLIEREIIGALDPYITIFGILSSCTILLVFFNWA